MNNKKEFNNYEEIIKSDLKEKYFKIKESLFRCGNFIIEINEKKEIEKIFSSFFDARKDLKNKY